MDGFGFFSCIQFFIMLGVCFAIIYRDRLIALEQRVIAFVQRVIAAIRRRRHNRQARELEDIGMSVVPAPAMSAEEVVRLIEEY